MLAIVIVISCEYNDVF